MLTIASGSSVNSAKCATTSLFLVSLLSGVLLTQNKEPHASIKRLLHTAPPFCATLHITSVLQIHYTTKLWYNSTLMKNNIHPNYNKQAEVTCSCGNVFAVGSVLPTLQVDICNKCHPFFTGEMRFVDRQGRVDRFLKKVQAAQTTKKGAKKKVEKQETEEARSYKDILRDQQLNLKSTKEKPATKEVAADPTPTAA